LGDRLVNASKLKLARSISTLAGWEKKFFGICEGIQQGIASLLQPIAPPALVKLDRPQRLGNLGLFGALVKWENAPR